MDIDVERLARNFGQGLGDVGDLVRQGQFDIELVEPREIEVEGDARLGLEGIVERDLVDVRVAVAVAADPRAELENVRQRAIEGEIAVPFAVQFDSAGRIERLTAPRRLLISSVTVMRSGRLSRVDHNSATSRYRSSRTALRSAPAAALAIRN